MASSLAFLALGAGGRAFESPRPDQTFNDSKRVDRFPAIAFSCFRTQLCQNCVKTPSIWPECARTPPALVGAPVQLAQRLSFHVQLHLRIFFEDLRIPLPEQLRLKFVINSTSA
jgi:hypothetical protein